MNSDNVYPKDVRIEGGSAEHMHMHEMSLKAQRITSELNSGFKEPDRRRELFSELIGKKVDDSFTVFPPFHCEYGLGITVGKNVFINADCCFQDQGGISIGDNVLIGHNVIIATLNHILDPSDRASMVPSPVTIGNNVWIGAGARILPGVTISDDAVVAMGAVVTKNVEKGAIVAGVPAKPMGSD